METFHQAQMRGTLRTQDSAEASPFCMESLEDGDVISPERWRAWEAKTRLRGKAHTRKVAVLVSAALLVLWLIGMITSNTLGGFIHILLLIAVGVLVIHVFPIRRSLM